ncbi:HEPN domain-containing protein [Nocardiopsis sp. NPDC006139]|uniref:HEPN domain-containing protein n=1 Tax=Nocardiopsis sp. NPDC006139 TaxID=3154578 RepID=UPI0033BC4CBC
MANSWPPYVLSSLRASIDQLAESIRERPRERSVDESVWLVRFFVVRTCGYLEQVVHETVKAYIDACSGGPVREFAHSWMARSRNPSPDNMLGLVGRLGGSFEESLRGHLEKDDQHLLREMHLLVDRRHKIAHGLNEGLNDRRALQLYDSAIEVADWFFGNLKPPR